MNISILQYYVTMLFLSYSFNITYLYIIEKKKGADCVFILNLLWKWMFSAQDMKIKIHTRRYLVTRAEGDTTLVTRYTLSIFDFSQNFIVKCNIF